VSREVEIRPTPDGPILIRGADVVTDAAGARHAVTRPIVAVCVCGKTSRGPWCDGTHKLGRKPESPAGR